MLVNIVEAIDFTRDRVTGSAAEDLGDFSWCV